MDNSAVECQWPRISLSHEHPIYAYVNDALRLKAEHDRRLRGIDDFIAAYEAEHGEITEEEMEAAYRRAKARAVVVRGGHVVDDKGTGVA